jgi:hypothetical protein
LPKEIVEIHRGWQAQVPGGRGYVDDSTLTFQAERKTTLHGDIGKSGVELGHGCKAIGVLGQTWLLSGRTFARAVEVCQQ